MKIAYCGNFIGVPYSTENDVKKAWEALGHEVLALQENQLTVDRLMAFDFDLFLITSTWDDALPLDQMITFYKECAERNIPTVTLHLDTFWGKSRGGRKWWLNPMFHTAYIFTADGDYQEQWKAFGKNHIWLPPAVRHDAVHFGTFRKEYECDVAFVGSNGVGYHEDVWPYRKELVDNLRVMCKRNGWSFKNPGGDDPKIDRGEDMNNFYASAKVTVGDSLCLKKEKSHYFSDRVMECWGRGGFLIMPYIEGIEDATIWPFHQPSYKWDDFEDLESAVKEWLGNEKQRKERVQTNQKDVKENHTYVNRVQKIINYVKR
jgi:hypothetical protein